jgi:hypothetical protein
VLRALLLSSVRLLHLRAMNMLYKGLKANATIVVVPSTALESMQLGGLAGITALTMGLGKNGAAKEEASAIVEVEAGVASPA